MTHPLKPSSDTPSPPTLTTSFSTPTSLSPSPPPPPTPSLPHTPLYTQVCCVCWVSPPPLTTPSPPPPLPPPLCTPPTVYRRAVYAGSVHPRGTGARPAESREDRADRYLWARRHEGSGASRRATHIQVRDSRMQELDGHQQQHEQQ